MIARGLIALARDWAGPSILATILHWTGLLAGALVIVLSFTWEYRTLMAGGPPEQFKWTVFFAGLLAAIGAFAHAWLKRPDRREPLERSYLV